jgi:hypothetical protein
MFASVIVSDAGAWDMVTAAGASILVAALAAILTVVLDAGVRWAFGELRIVFFPCLLGGMLVGLTLRLLSPGSRSELMLIVLGAGILYVVRWWLILDYPMTFQQTWASLREYSHGPFSLSAGGRLGGRHAHAETAGNVTWFWVLFLLDAAAVFLNRYNQDWHTHSTLNCQL